MKKITLLLSSCFLTIGMYAQNYYNFEKSTATYQDLANATSMNNNEPWMFDDFGPFSTPFPISIFGENHSNFGFDGDNFVFINTSESVYSLFYPYSTFITDRNFSQIGTSLSPISYKVDGTAGSRILKLEIKNAGLETDLDFDMPNFGTSTYFLNYQIWFYEADNSFEYHFGPTNITSLAVLNNEGSLISFFYSETETEESYDVRVGFVNGTIATPIYTEAFDDEDEPTSLDAMITANTVYRFSLNTLATKDQEKVEFAMYPNPTSGNLNLTFAENLDKDYSVYDLLGREVLKGKFDNVSQATISVNQLQVGTYVLKIGGTTKKFIKK